MPTECPAEASEVPTDVLAATREGHTLKQRSASDLVGVSLWQCTTCPDAVLKNGTAIYGRATTNTCTESQAFWASVGGPVE